MHSRRQFLMRTSLTFGLLFSSCSVQKQKKFPNFIIFIGDDIGWNDIGAYGHPTIRTPNIDRLAKEGMIFTNAFLTASQCSPTRASVITGRYPHNAGAQDLHDPLPEAQITITELLRNSGINFKVTIVRDLSHSPPLVTMSFIKLY